MQQNKHNGRAAPVSFGTSVNKKLKKEETGKKVKKEKTFCCIPCTLPLSADCGQCIFCKDKTKFGGTGKLRQKCVVRTCEKKTKNVK